jgi:NADH:ubiquinone oxidoreductase subunit 5 (subunit L)/multisubunit Na+/H+ antiporter MnhA subunit/multisubunit Na+/H+ antiporter MnhB subunit
MELVLINAIPFLLSLLMALPETQKLLKRQGMTWLSTGVMALLFVWLLSFLPEATGETAFTHVIEWVPDLGLTLSWYLDGLALTFALIVTGIGVAVFLYAGYYMDDDVSLARFYGYLFAFSGSMLAVVMAGNLFMLFIAWEGTSIMSFLLIGFKNDKSEDSRIASSRALVITGGGGLAMFVGLMLMGWAAGGIANGGFELSTLLDPEMGHFLRDHGWYTAFTLLIMIGAFTKSAQFPFHFWLPGAMTAPSPASAYLHSATMVKAGVYLLFRLYPVLGESWFWTNSLVIIGLTTMFIGALFAIRQRDLKGLLAYSTVSKLGVIVALIGLPESHGLKAAFISILAHALYKATFFLLAGAIEHATGTRNLDDLGGLRKKMPVAFLVAGVVGLSMAGVPPMIGFAAKEFLLDELLPSHGISIIPVIIAVISSILTVVAALLFVWDVFVSRPDQEYHHYHKNPNGLILGPALLAIMTILSGLFIAEFYGDLLNNVMGKSTKLYLIPPELNPFENTAFALSLTVLTLGPILFMYRRVWLNMPWINVPSGASLYAGFMGFWDWLGDQLLLLQNGKVRYYLVVILGVVSGLMFFGGFDNFRSLNISITTASELLKTLLLILTIGSTLASIMIRSHLTAVLSLGVAGYAIGGLFLLEPAPDVALVQILVETLTTVLLILMIARISSDQRNEVMQNLWRGARGDNRGIYRDLAISIVVGLSVGLFALAAVNDREGRVEAMREVQALQTETTRPITSPVTEWYLENAYKQTDASDVVSSILADFRGMDTMLEITVFSMAALGVLTLLTIPSGGEMLAGRRITQTVRVVAADENNDGDDRFVDMASVRHLETLDEYEDFSEKVGISRFSNPSTRLAANLVMPFALMISISHVLYGGGGPGDGFTAGVVSGLAVALWYVVFGYFEARARLRWLRPGRLIMAGLLLAITNATLGLIIEGAFFRIIIPDIDPPAGLHLTSTLLFELSVFLAVFGGVTFVMNAIAYPRNMEESE